MEGPSSGYVTTAFVLPHDGQWHHVVFLIDAAHLTPVNSPAPLATLLANVGELRIVNAASPSNTGDPVVSSIGIDNITAVPKPASLALLLLGTLALLPRRRR